MTYQAIKNQYGTKIKKLVDIHLHKCKYTDQQWVNYGSGTLQSSMSDIYTGNILLSGTQATQFNETFVWAIFGGSSELVKCTVTDDLNLEVISRGEFGTNPNEHSVGTSVKIIHSGEADGTCYGLTGCSAVNNYVKDLDLVFRFASSNLEFGEKYYSGLESEKPSTPTIDPSESMGSRGKTKIEILDGLDADGYVPYPNNRTDLATLWTKLIARNPYFEGRRCVVYDGFDSPPLNLADFQRREYLIDDLQLNDGNVSIKCLDPLILTENKKAKAPLASPSTLAVAIDDSTTSFTYDGVDFYYGPLNSFVYIRIDSEVIYCEVTDAKELTVQTRAFGGTDKKDHDLDATVQEVLHYDKVNVVEIIVDLLERFTTVPAEYLDDYSQVIASTSSVLLTAWISKPEEVKKLIDELIKTGLLSMWFSPNESKIKIKRSSDPDLQPISLNESDHIEQSSYNNTRDPSSQSTRFSVAWGLNDITKTSGEENFSTVFTPISVDKEQPQNKGEVNEKKIFFCRWLVNSTDDSIIAFNIANDEISKNQNVPEIIEFNVDRKDIGITDSGNLDLASVINVTTSRRVNPDGSSYSKNYQVLSLANVDDNKIKIKAELYQQPISGDDVDFVISEDKENYDLSTEFAPTAGHYTILVEQGVKIGSTSVSNPAFTTGVQALGVSFTIVLNGQILGAGGDGGGGGDAIAPNFGDLPTLSVVPGFDGDDGGIGLEITVDTIINAGSGIIAGGGGGAGGDTSVADSRTPSSYVSAGNGGSGGQGWIISKGGKAGLAEVESSAIDNGLPGADGSNSSPGSVAEKSGGAYGKDGDDSHGSAIGGKSGLSIKKNGNTLTIQSGAVDPNGNIRGPIGN